MVKRKRPVLAINLLSQQRRRAGGYFIYYYYYLLYCGGVIHLLYVRILCAVYCAAYSNNLCTRVLYRGPNNSAHGEVILSAEEEHILCHALCVSLGHNTTQQYIVISLPVSYLWLLGYTDIIIIN